MSLLDTYRRLRCRFSTTYFVRNFCQSYYPPVVDYKFPCVIEKGDGTADSDRGVAGIVLHRLMFKSDATVLCWSNTEDQGTRFVQGVLDVWHELPHFLKTDRLVVYRVGFKLGSSIIKRISYAYPDKGAGYYQALHVADLHGVGLSSLTRFLAVVAKPEIRAGSKVLIRKSGAGFEHAIGFFTRNLISYRAINLR